MPKVIDEIPPEFLKAIGDVVVRWNRMEIEVNTLLIHWLGKDIRENRSHVIFTHMSFPQKLDVMGALVEELTQEKKYSYLKACKTRFIPLLKKAQIGRNMVIHSMWGTLNGNVMRASITARGSLKLSWSVASLDEINEVKRIIEQVDEDLLALISGNLLD